MLRVKISLTGYEELPPALFLSGITILNNIILLITRNCLSLAQASSCYKSLDMYTPMYSTPTFVTEELCLVTYVVLNDCISEVMAYLC